MKQFTENLKTRHARRVLENIRRTLMKQLATALVLLILATLSPTRPHAHSPTRPLADSLTRWTYTASAGNTSTSDTYIVQGTLGQPTVETSAGSTYAVTSGIWRKIPATKPTAVYLPLLLHNHPPPPPHTYLPYLVQNWPPIHLLTDAPDNCPGHGPVQFTPHQYRDDFDHQSDQDWYILRATAGVTYTIQTSQLGPNSDTVLELYATDCATLLELHDDIHYPDNVASRITWYAPASGDYHIKVRHYNWTTYGPDTNYTLTIREEQ